jgi:8-oxo-dGTP diphosphatase
VDTSVGVVRVVGVAVLRPRAGGAQVLAALRRPGPDAPGGWEFPGGKCGAGEPLDRAAEREVREELGCRVRVTGRLTGVQPIRPGLTLEVVLAELVDGEPVASEHEELRWLSAEELDDLPWLAADRPFLAELRTRLEEAR